MRAVMFVSSPVARSISPWRSMPIRAKSRIGIWQSSGSIRPGKDTGSAQPCCARGCGAAIRRERPTYFESSKLENVPLYQHFGFHVTGSLGLPAGVPVVNTMCRPANVRLASGHPSLTD
jgi:hypothetical protein